MSQQRLEPNGDDNAQLEDDLPTKGRLLDKKVE